MSDESFSCGRIATSLSAIAPGDLSTIPGMGRQARRWAPSPVADHQGTATGKLRTNGLIYAKRGIDLIVVRVEQRP